MLESTESGSARTDLKLYGARARIFQTPCAPARPAHGLVLTYQGNALVPDIFPALHTLALTPGRPDLAKTRLRVLHNLAVRPNFFGKKLWDDMDRTQPETLPIIASSAPSDRACAKRFAEVRSIVTLYEDLAD